MRATVKVLGGLEITVEFRMCGAEPDVGIMSDYFEDWSICEIAGRPLRKKESADWIYKRLSKRDETAIEEAIYAAMDDTKNDYFDEPYDDY
jgi:uncharacterized membrane protein YcaP (DUF421 family)